MAVPPCRNSPRIRTKRSTRSPTGSRPSRASNDTPQVFRLFGYAGTGKTTLARTIADACRRRGEIRRLHRQGGLGDARQGLPRRLHHPWPDLPRARERRGGAELRPVGRGAGLQGRPHRHRRMLHGRCRARPRSALVRRAAAGARRSGATAADPGRRLLHRGRARRHAHRGAPAGAGRPDRAAVDGHPRRRISRAWPLWRDAKWCARPISIRRRVLDADQVLVGRNATRRAYNLRMRERRGFEDADAGGRRQARVPAQQPQEGPVQRRAVDGEGARRAARAAS